MKLKLPVQFMNQKLKLSRIDESRANYTLHQSCQSMHMDGVLIHLSESNLLNQFTTKICSDLFLSLTPKHTEQFSWSWTKCYSIWTYIYIFNYNIVVLDWLSFCTFDLLLLLISNLSTENFVRKDLSSWRLCCVHPIQKDAECKRGREFMVLTHLFLFTACHKIILSKGKSQTVKTALIFLWQVLLLKTPRLVGEVSSVRMVSIAGLDLLFFINEHSNFYSHFQWMKNEWTAFLCVFPL